LLYETCDLSKGCWGAFENDWLNSAELELEPEVEANAEADSGLRGFAFN